MKIINGFIAGLLLVAGCAQVHAEDCSERSMKRHEQFRAEQKKHETETEKKELKPEAISN